MGHFSMENSGLPGSDLSGNQHPFGNNKSPAAKRQIALASILTAAERSVLERVLASHRQTAEAQKLPLLRIPGSNLPLDKGKFSDLVSKVMRKTLNGNDWTFHHLRHSAFNNLFLVLEDLGDISRGVHGWPLEQTEKVRAAVVGNKTSRQKAYFGLAAFAGHASPTETFGSYIHLARDALSEHVAKMDITATHDLYAAALGTSQKLLADCKTDGEFRLFLEGRLQSRFAPVIEWDLEEEVAAETPPPFEEMVWRAFNILSYVEEGATLEAANLQGVPAEDVARWFARARAIAAHKSRKRAELHVSKGRQKRHGDNPRKVEILLPADLNREADRNDATSLMRAFAAFKREDPVQAAQALQYALKHIVQSKAGIRFTNIEDLRAVLQVFESARVFKNRWYLEIRLADPESVPAWRARFPETTRHVEKRLKTQASIRPSWAKGHVFLHLENSGWTSKRSIKDREPRSSRALRFVIHMLGIVDGGIGPADDNAVNDRRPQIREETG